MAYLFDTDAISAVLKPRPNPGYVEWLAAVQSVGEIGRRERLSSRYVRRVIRLGVLAPTIVEAILDGGHPETLTAIALTRRIDLPALWSTQEQVLGLRTAGLRV